MKSISFVGRVSGDNECFCWADVPEADMRTVLGDDGYEEELQNENDKIWLWNEGEQIKIPEVTTIDRLYPDCVFSKILKDNQHKLFRFTISVEEVEKETK